MPTYEYRCNGCKREFEVQQKMSDPDLVHCDECGQDKLEKLISWTSVRSDTWQSALSSDNPKEAMKGLHAVDRSRPPKKEAPAGSSAPAAEASAPTTQPATPAGTVAASPSTPSTATGATPAGTISAPSTAAGDNDATDDEGDESKGT